MPCARWSVCFVFLLVLFAPPLSAQDDVRVRGHGHSEFGRLVFDWPASVGFKAEISGRNLIVRFDRAMKADFTAASSALNDYASGVELSTDYRTASFRLKGDFSLRSFANGNSVVIDVLRKKSAASASSVPQSGGAAPALGVRKGQHPKYDRLVFDWTRPVEYSLDRNGGSVTLNFNRPARIDIANVRSGLGRGFANPSATAEGGRLRFSVGVATDARIRHFRAGTKVVLDVFRDGTTQETRQAAAAPPAQAAPVVPVKQEAKASDTAAPGAKRPMLLVPKSPATAPKETSAALSKPEAAKKPKQVESKSDDAAPQAKTKPEGAPAARKTVEKAKEELKAGEKPKAADEPQAAEQPTAAAQPAADDKAEESKPEAALDPITLAFGWPEVVTMATFRRNKYVWIVFGQRTVIQTAPLLKQSRALIERLDQVPSGRATVLRVQTKNDGINVSNIQLNGSNWLIEFAQSPMRPIDQIAFGVSQTDSQGAQLLMPLEEFGQLFTFTDPDVGDSLQVVTVAQPGLGMDEERAYPEFQLLASAQGVAVETFNSDLVLNKLQKAIVFGGPEGLYVSEVVSVPSKLDAKALSQLSFGAIGSQILEPAKWQKGGLDKLIEVRQEYMNGIIKQSPRRRAKGRTELARYNFSHGFAHETLGIIDVVEFTDLEAASAPEFVALKGAALVLAERGKAAQKALNDSRLDGYQDISVWRGAADYLMGDIASASKNFDAGDPSLQNYPNPLKGKLLVPRLAVALETGQTELAQKWREKLADELDELGQTYKGRLSYLFGRLYRDELDFDNAVGAYQVAADSGDVWSGVRAEYELVDFNLQQETIEVSEAVQRLERLRFAWRGDAFERKVLDRLAELYIADSAYRNGLNTLKVIVSYFPKHPDAQAAARKMKDIFRRLYIDGEADNISPLKALALYDEFRELTPAGPEGNRMIQKLAERLVNVDLLDKASDVLGHQVKFRLKGEEKAAVGTKLALIRLIARDPQGALDALRDSYHLKVSIEIEDDRRRIRAKAEFELGKANDAIALLAGDVSREADQLRSAIYFRERNWGEAAKVYQRLVGGPPEEGETVDGDAGRTALLWAVALKLNRDEEGLRQLFDLYGPGMKGSPLAATFDYIARPSDGVGFDAGTIQKRIADVDQFQAFMKNYRERLLNSGGGEAKPEAQTSRSRDSSTPNG